MAQQAQTAGQWETAATHYRRALRWYLPLLPHRAEAFNALATMATDAEKQGQRRRALWAWREAVAGLNASSWPLSLGDKRLQRAESNVSRLVSSQDESVAHSATESSTRPAASTLGSLLILFGFGLWLVALFRLARIEQKASVEQARNTLVSAVVGFILFAMGIVFA